MELLLLALPWLRKKMPLHDAGRKGQPRKAHHDLRLEQGPSQKGPKCDACLSQKGSVANTEVGKLLSTWSRQKDTQRC